MSESLIRVLDDARWFWRHTRPCAIIRFRASVYGATICRVRGHERSDDPVIARWDKGHLCKRCFAPLGWGADDIVICSAVECEYAAGHSGPHSPDFDSAEDGVGIAW